MRVISGIAKGARLKIPEGARPTADNVRSAIFNVIAGDCDGSRVLDLFAGSGALGIEALSRGAAEAMFVEADPGACRVIEQNLAAAKLSGDMRRQDVERFLAREAKQSYDLVFLDPPYERGLPFVARILAKLAAGNWVSPGGTIVAESPAGDLELPASFRRTRTKRFGRTQVTIAVNDGEA